MVIFLLDWLSAEVKRWLHAFPRGICTGQNVCIFLFHNYFIWQASHRKNLLPPLSTLIKTSKSVVEAV